MAEQRRWTIRICEECGQKNNWHAEDCTFLSNLSKWPEAQQQGQIDLEVVPLSDLEETRIELDQAKESNG